MQEEIKPQPDMPLASVQKQVLTNRSVDNDRLLGVLAMIWSGVIGHPLTIANVRLMLHQQ
jgi:hypothetical protein